MIPPAFITFFAASLAADGALIGLLFVAIAIEPERTFGSSAALDRELAANGAFAGLVNAFLISMLALIPNINIGFAVIVIAAFSLLNTVVHVVDKLQRGNSAYARSLFYTIGGLLVYGLEIFYGIQLIRQPGATDAVYQPDPGADRRICRSARPRVDAARRGTSLVHPCAPGCHPGQKITYTSVCPSR